MGCAYSGDSYMEVVPEVFEEGGPSGGCLVPFFTLFPGFPVDAHAKGEVDVLCLPEVQIHRGLTQEFYGVPQDGQGLEPCRVFLYLLHAPVYPRACHEPYCLRVERD